MDVRLDDDALEAHAYQVPRDWDLIYLLSFSGEVKIRKTAQMLEEGAGI